MRRWGRIWAYGYTKSLIPHFTRGNNGFSMSCSWVWTNKTTKHLRKYVIINVFSVTFFRWIMKTLFLIVWIKNNLYLELEFFGKGSKKLGNFSESQVRYANLYTDCPCINYWTITTWNHLRPFCGYFFLIVCHKNSRTYSAKGSEVTIVGCMNHTV